MAGFLSGSTALSIFAAPGAAKFDIECLRKHAFTPDIDTDGVRVGWVGLGNALDEDFSFGIMQGNNAVFSLRVDTRKLSAAAVKLKVAEVIREEMKGNALVPRRRKSEIKDAVVAALTAKAEFIPMLTDCLLDFEKERLLVGAASAKNLLQVQELFKNTFGVEPVPLSPESGIVNTLVEICRNAIKEIGAFSVCPHGSATLVRMDENGEKSLVTVQNNLSAVLSTLDEGMILQKVRLLITNLKKDEECIHDFTLDTNFTVSGLKLPKALSSDEEDADLFLKMDACAEVADFVSELSSMKAVADVPHL